jgi:hypothetical protein
MKKRFSKKQIAEFNSHWPGSTIPEKACWFEFDKDGNLIDTNCDADGPEVLALIEL